MLKYEREKCVFTCLVSRAVHIEVVNDISLQGFANAFLRFIGRRGAPDSIILNSGTQFVAVSMKNTDKIFIYLASRGMEMRCIRDIG